MTLAAGQASRGSVSGRAVRWRAGEASQLYAALSSSSDGWAGLMRRNMASAA